MKTICMIPARLGSTRIKKKNLKLLGGVPLIFHAIKNAIDSNVFDEIYVNSESRVFEKFTYGSKFYLRPKRLASNKALNDDFVRDFIAHIKSDYLIQLNTTSPFIKPESIKRFVHLLHTERVNTLLTVKECRIECVYQKDEINFNPTCPMPPSQELEPVYLFTSGLMGWKTDTFQTTYGGRCYKGYMKLSGYETIDIDTPEDFELAEMIWRVQHVRE